MPEKKSDMAKACALCGGSGVLSQVGILKIYFLPHKFSIFLMAVSIVLGITYSAYALWLVPAGIILPVFSADFRMLLYPYVVLGKLLGKRPNCPACEPTGPVFRNS